MSLADSIERALTRGGTEGLLQAARRIKNRADQNLPVGDPAVDPDPALSIKDSGYIEVHGRVVEIGYRAPYSAKQHEDQHLKHPRGGGPKFLERALLEEIPRLDDIVAGEVRKNLSGRRR